MTSPASSGSNMKLNITPYNQNDIEELYNVISASSAHLKPWMPWLHDTYCIDDTAGWVNLCIKDWEGSSAYRYLIRAADNNKILGAVGIDRIERVHRVAELGYWVAANALNRGVATCAARQAVFNAFLDHALNRVEIHVLTDNLASNRVAVKIGAKFEGTFRNKLFHNGHSKAANCYSIIPNDYAT